VKSVIVGIALLAATQLAAQADTTQTDTTARKLFRYLVRLDISSACILDFRALGIAELAEPRMQRENLTSDRAYAAEAVDWIHELEKEKVPAFAIRKIMCGDVAVGMTGRLVWLAKGTPEETVSEETAGGVVEVRTFDGVAVTLRDKKVIKITRVFR
jgi:uncharacterized protein YodC (DUF2158 family)